MNSLPVMDLRAPADREAFERRLRVDALLEWSKREAASQLMDALWAARFRTRRPVELLTDAEWFQELDDHEECA